MGQLALSSSKGVSIVLVTWNSAPYLRRCLDGILQQTYLDRELIVVDNASSDPSADLVAPHATRVIRNETNRGFSAAVNQALAVASGEFLLVLNPDCYLEEEYVERLVRVFESTSLRVDEEDSTSRRLDDATTRRLEDSSTRLGSATGLLIRARGWDIEPTRDIDSAGMRMTRNGRHLDIATRPAGLTEVFGVSGAAAMYRVAFLRDISIDGEALDEDFFAYREDADVAWRGQLRGWKAVCEPQAVAYHVRRVTPEKRRTLPADVNLHSVKNRFLLRIRNEGAYLALRNAPFELARDLLVIVAALTIERSSLPAFAWLWRNRKRVLAKRRLIQSRRTVHDRDLAKWFR
ncbi:MAG TPA: glycosyltransferase family 2 protein [Thermoanaerobaculia bacterium]|nr:glycosyltransferase family 2 protein [Thermoanaerobaculia bacterium]